MQLTSTPIGAIPNCPYCRECERSPACDADGCEACASDMPLASAELSVQSEVRGIIVTLVENTRGHSCYRLTDRGASTYAAGAFPAAAAKQHLPGLSNVPLERRHPSHRALASAAFAATAPVDGPLPNLCSSPCDGSVQRAFLSPRGKHLNGSDKRVLCRRSS